MLSALILVFPQSSPTSRRVNYRKIEELEVELGFKKRKSYYGRYSEVDAMMKEAYTTPISDISANKEATDALERYLFWRDVR